MEVSDLETTLAGEKACFAISRRVGVHITVFGACPNFTPVTAAGLLARLWWALSRGFDLPGYPNPPLASYRI
jgi:hypothetical protein